MGWVISETENEQNHVNIKCTKTAENHINKIFICLKHGLDSKYEEKHKSRRPGWVF